MAEEDNKEEERKQRYYENWMQFIGSEVVNPKSETFFEFLTRDMDLGNIDSRAWLEISRRVDFANELIMDGYEPPALQLFSESSSLMLISRSRDGFQQKMLTTSNQNQNIKSEVTQPAQSGGGGLLGMFRRKK